MSRMPCGANLFSINWHEKWIEIYRNGQVFDHFYSFRRSASRIKSLPRAGRWSECIVENPAVSWTWSSGPRSQLHESSGRRFLLKKWVGSGVTGQSFKQKTIKKRCLSLYQFFPHNLLLKWRLYHFFPPGFGWFWFSCQPFHQESGIQLTEEQSEEFIDLPAAEGLFVSRTGSNPLFFF